jgi:hypothetical protein
MYSTNSKHSLKSLKLKNRIFKRDVDIILGIEERIKKKMTEYPIDENPVLELLNAVNMGKRQASMELDDSKFGAKKLTQKEKGTTAKTLNAISCHIHLK